MFDGYIVRSNCTIGMQELANHSKVARLRSLPRGWLTYEFHDPLFADPDFYTDRWQAKMDRYPAMRQAQITMRTEERSLLLPWYEKKRKLGDADAIFTCGETTYMFASLTPLRWVEYDVDAATESSARVLLKLELTDSTEPPKILGELIDEWASSAKGECDRASEVRWEHGSCLLSLSKPSGDLMWIGALWVLLCDRRWKTCVSKFTLRTEQG
jgi:hypothetical protein